MAGTAFVGIGQGGGGSAEPRWCKRCEKVFTADKCDAGHPVFSYTKKIPENAGSSAAKNPQEAAPADHDRLYRGRHGGLDIAAWASEDSASAAKLPTGGADDTLFGDDDDIDAELAAVEQRLANLRKKKGLPPAMEVLHNVDGGVHSLHHVPTKEELATESSIVQKLALELLKHSPTAQSADTSATSPMGLLGLALQQQIGTPSTAPAASAPPQPVAAPAAAPATGGWDTVNVPAQPSGPVTVQAALDRMMGGGRTPPKPAVPPAAAPAAAAPPAPPTPRSPAPKPPPGMSIFEEMAWRKQQSGKLQGGAGAAPGAPQPPGNVPPAPPQGSAPNNAARKAELEALPAFKLKAAAKEAGVQPLPIGQPARTKDETIALILELEGSAGGAMGSAAAPPAPPPPGAGPPAPPAPPAAPNQSGSASTASSAGRKAELEALPAFKLKAAAKEAGVQPLPIGQPARTKDETIALILELEGSAGGPPAPPAPPPPSGAGPPAPPAPPPPPGAGPPAPPAPPPPPGQAARQSPGPEPYRPKPVPSVPQPEPEPAPPAVNVTFQNESKSASFAAEIAQLDRLRQLGALSDNEFEVAKQKVLTRAGAWTAKPTPPPSSEDRKQIAWSEDVKDVNREDGRRKGKRSSKKKKNKRKDDSEEDVDGDMDVEGESHAVTVAEDPAVRAVLDERQKLEAEARKAKAARLARRAKEQSVYEIVEAGGSEFGLPADQGAGFLEWRLEDDEDIFSEPKKQPEKDLLPKSGREKRIAQLDHEARNPLLPQLNFDRESAASVYSAPREASVGDIGNFLASLELSDYVIPFQEHEIDGDALLELTQEQLFSEVGLNDLEDLALLWEEIELLRDVAAEIEAEEYAADSEAALRAQQASLTKDQTQLLDSSLPMKNVRAGNPLSQSAAATTQSTWESGGFSTAGGAGAVNVGGSNNGGGVSKGPREPSAVRAAKAVEGIKTVDACHDAAQRLLHKGFAPGSSGAAHTEAVEDALALMREWYSSRNNDTGQTKPSRFHEILLKQCEEHKLPSLAALTVFKNLCDAALPRNEHAYGHVLRVLCNNGQPPGVVDDLNVAVKVLKKMEEEGFELTTDEFDQVIRGFAAHGQLESALETADYAVLVNTNPALETFEKVLEACETNGDLRVATEMFKLLDAAEMPPSGLCYQSLLRTAIAAEDTRFSAKVWRTMLTEGHAGENVLDLCAELLDSFGKAGPSAAPLLDRVWDTLEPNFVGPDDTTYTALISAFAKCGDVGSAARYLVEMAESVYTPSLGLLEEVLEATVEPGAADEALVCFELWREVRRRAGFHESTNSAEPYDAAIQAAIRAGDAEMASEILATARSAKIQLSADVVDGLVLLYAGRNLAAGKTMYDHCLEIGQIPSLTVAQMERKAAKQNTAKPRDTDLDGTLVPVLPV